VQNSLQKQRVTRFTVPSLLTSVPALLGGVPPKLNRAIIAVYGAIVANLHRYCVTGAIVGIIRHRKAEWHEHAKSRGTRHPSAHRYT
jgi:hypothetical protein